MVILRNEIYTINRKRGGRPKSLTDNESLEVVQLVKENPKQMRKVLSIIKERFGKEVSINTVKDIIKKRLHLEKMSALIKKQKKSGRI